MLGYIILGLLKSSQYFAPHLCIAYHSYLIPVSALLRFDKGILNFNKYEYTEGYCSLKAFSAFSDAPCIVESN